MTPTRTLIPIDGCTLCVQITDDGSRTLVDTATGVAYHSASGAAAETTHVYLFNSGVASRLAEGLPTSVLEVGFGVGLGMLLTLDAAVAGGAALRYTALEHQLLEHGVLRQLQMDQQLRDPTLAVRFLQWRRELGQPLEGIYRWRAAPEKNIELHCIEATTWNDAGVAASFDAIYFDPFAPDANPELWRPEFLARMHRLLRSGGRLVTYCVSRKVRDDFASVGFDVRRVKGPPGGKREVMVASKGGAP